ncbi:MAG: cyclic nucleotide-binding domain-containing protein [Dehalococcoidia bacterium]
MFGDDQSDIQELLRKVPLFSDLNKKSLKEIGEITEEVEREAGDVLAQEGKAGKAFVFIVEGKVRVEKEDKLVNRLSAYDFFGEISLIDGRPRTATVIAETDVKLLVIHSSYFDEILDKVPGLSRKIMMSLCKYLRQTQKQISAQHTSEI